MTLRMADGPVANLPAGLDAYAGYVNKSGIGVTWPNVQQIPAKYHLSITTNDSKDAYGRPIIPPADCADIESGAMASWTGYPVGYCSISNAQALIHTYGRPTKLWTAHYDPHLGAHICSPSCGFGFTGHADGTQWTDHGGAWDESLLLDNFFDYQQPTPAPVSKPGEEMDLITLTGHPTYLCIGTAAAQVIQPQDVNSLLAEGAILRRLDALTPDLQTKIMAKLAAQAA